MKKIFLLVGILFISILTFGTNEGKATEGKVEVKATIIRSLSVESTQPVDFGILIQGSKGIKSALGYFVVKGEEGQKIAIYVKAGNKYVRVTKHDLMEHEVELIRENGTEKLTAMLNVAPDGNNEGYGKEGNVILPSGGVQKFSVGGHIGDISSNQKPGQYKGYLHVKVQYD